MKLKKVDIHNIKDLLQVEFNRTKFSIIINSSDLFSKLLKIIFEDELYKDMTKVEELKLRFKRKQKFYQKLYKLFESMESKQFNQEIHDTFGEFKVNDFSISFTLDIQNNKARYHSCPPGYINLKNYKEVLALEKERKSFGTSILEPNAIVVIYLCYLDTILSKQDLDKKVTNLTQVEIIRALITILEYFSETYVSFNPAVISSTKGYFTENSIKLKLARFKKNRGDNPQYFEMVYKYLKKLKLKTNLLD